MNDLSAKGDGPLVLPGDRNATPDSGPMRELVRSWALATPAADRLRTIPADAPRQQIDYVLFRPFSQFRTTDAQVIDETVASDHRPVLAVLEWAGRCHLARASRTVRVRPASGRR